MPANNCLPLLTALLCWLLLSIARPAAGQDSLKHRTLDFYLEQGLQNSPRVAENINSLSLNRRDSLLNVAVNKPYVQAIGQFLYAPKLHRSAVVEPDRCQTQQYAPTRQSVTNYGPVAVMSVPVVIGGIRIRVVIG